MPSASQCQRSTTTFSNSAQVVVSKTLTVRRKETPFFPSLKTERRWGLTPVNRKLSRNISAHSGVTIVRSLRGFRSQKTRSCCTCTSSSQMSGWYTSALTIESRTATITATWIIFLPLITKSRVQKSISHRCFYTCIDDVRLNYSSRPRWAFTNDFNRDQFTFSFAGAIHCRLTEVKEHFDETRWSGFWSV